MSGRTLEVKRVAQLGDRVRIVAPSRAGTIGTITQIQGDQIWLDAVEGYWHAVELEVIGLAGEAVSQAELALSAAARTRDEIAWEKKVLAAARAYKAAWVLVNESTEETVNVRDLQVASMGLMHAVLL